MSAYWHAKWAVKGVGHANLTVQVFLASAVGVFLFPSTSFTRGQQPFFSARTGRHRTVTGAMVLYSTYPGSPFSTSFYLRQTLKYLAEQEGRALFSIKSVTLGCSQTVLNPDGKAIADVVEVTMRSSTIGTNTVDRKQSCRRVMLFPCWIIRPTSNCFVHPTSCCCCFKPI